MLGSNRLKRWIGTLFCLDQSVVKETSCEEIPNCGLEVSPQLSLERQTLPFRRGA